MSLQVWLPLNKEGDFLNKGLADITIYNYNDTVSYSSSGKIGGTYIFTEDVNSYLYASSANILSKINNNSFSIACWGRRNSGDSTYLLVSITYGIMLATNGFVCYNSSAYKSLSNKNSYDATKWHHYTGTYDTTTGVMSFYVDGQLDNTMTISTGYNTSWTNYLGIGVNWNNSGNATYHLDGNVSDVRIYDHCLSPQEVKLISQGLVLHYPLNEQPLKANLFPDPLFNTLSGNSYVFKDTSKTYNGYPSYKVTRSGATSSTYTGYSLEVTSVMLPGHTYTVSYYAYTDDKSTIDGSCEWRCYQRYTKDDGTTTTDWSSFWGSYSNMINGLWVRIVATGTVRATTTSIYFNTNVVKNGTFWISCPKIEESSQASDFTLLTTDQKIHDCSGYSNDGIITGTLTTSTDTPRYDKCTYFVPGNYVSSSITIPANYYTISFWLKLDTPLSSNTWTLLIKLGNRGIIYYAQSTRLKYETTGILLSTYTDLTKLHHFAFVVNGTNKAYGYVDGSPICSWDSTIVDSDITQFQIGYTSSEPGLISDARLYMTALSADDIKDLYQTSAYILEDGTVESYLFEENINNYNIFRDVLKSITEKSFSNGVLKYEQTYCKCTITDEGYRIVRAANLNYNSGSNSVMWGGLFLYNTNNQFGLTKGHTYLLEFDVKGISDNAATDIYWTCLPGWGGGECAPKPTNIVNLNPVTANFNSNTWLHFSYKFTINDDIYKTCTTSYNSNSFVAGTTYISYHSFKFGWTYTNTGTNGTDVYLNHFRMFDITTDAPTQIDVNKNGQIEAFTLTENGDNAFIDSYEEVNGNQLIEI